MSQGMAPRDIDDITITEWHSLQAMFLGGLVGPLLHSKQQYQTMEMLYKIVATIRSALGEKTKPFPRHHEIDPQIFKTMLSKHIPKQVDAVDGLARMLLSEGKGIPDWMNKHLNR